MKFDVPAITKAVAEGLPRFRFYTTLLVLALTGVTAILAAVVWRISEIDDRLFPTTNSVLPWRPTLDSDTKSGGTSTIAVRNNGAELVVDFNLTNGVQYPYISFILELADRARPETLVDLTKYTSISFDIGCSLRNILTMELYSYDPAVTKPGVFTTYRVSRAYFPCDVLRRSVTIDLRNLEVQEWWLTDYGAEFSDRTYRLDKVVAVALLNSIQSPRDTLSSMTISGAALQGRNWPYVYVVGILVSLVWIGFFYWYIKRRTELLIEGAVQKLQQGLPVIAYQQVPASQAQDRDRASVLRYMSEQYTNPDLSLEIAVAELGINRTKINEILKDELELTFSSYVTKLRLAEAARLLMESDSSVTDIAHAVGYGSASYFTTVFKKEYGCAPKTFKKQLGGQEQQAPPEI